jgi:uncharacterized membrane protein YecN with MAPEG domain
MDFAALVALLALIEYLVISTMTGRARDAYGIKAPATAGHPMFERWYRVQMNTLEQLVIFLPALFLFASYVSPRWGGVLGLVFVAGRAIYARSYLADPETRSVGFALTFVPNVLLLFGTLLAVVF